MFSLDFESFSSVFIYLPASMEPVGNKCAFSLLHPWTLPTRSHAWGQKLGILFPGNLKRNVCQFLGYHSVEYTNAQEIVKFCRKLWWHSTEICIFLQPACTSVVDTLSDRRIQTGKQKTERDSQSDYTTISHQVRKYIWIKHNHSWGNQSTNHYSLYIIFMNIQHVINQSQSTLHITPLYLPF